MTVNYLDPRFRISIYGRIFIRFSVYVIYWVIIPMTLLFLVSDSYLLIGIFFLIFLLDRFFHVGEGEIEINPNKISLNYSAHLSARSFKILESSLDQALLTNEIPMN